MCALNHTHEKCFVLEVFTFAPAMTKQEFERLVAEKVLFAEIELNVDGRHLRETPPNDRTERRGTATLKPPKIL